jgi:nucleotide-binding universal stress UspA family protein
VVSGNPDAAAADSDDHANMFETILLAADGSANTDAAFAYAQRLAGHYGSGVLVVCIGATSSVSRSIRRHVRQLRSDGVRARLAVVAEGRDTASVIVHLADAWNADLLLVGSGSGAAGSGMAQRLLESSPCPVLAVPDSVEAGLAFRFGSQQPGLEGVVDEVGARREPQLHEDVSSVRLDGANAHEKPRGDLLVRVPTGQ